MKIGTITFHGAHNHGSMLQTYALQTYIERLLQEQGVDCEYSVINLRTPLQKELYFQKASRDFRTIIKSLMRLPYYQKLKQKSRAFESFLAEYVHLTPEVNSPMELSEFSDNFDIYLSGSDQIWNVRSRDFCLSYLLNFTDRMKISYAASFGPLEIDWSKYPVKQYADLLCEYKSISVREEQSKQVADRLLGENRAEVHVDPTLLLSREDWCNVQSNRNYNNGKYIFFYCLEPTKDHLRIAKLLSKRLHLPVVIDGYRGKKDYFNSFVKLYDAGPRDFLSLIDHAALVLTSSFHGTAFSVIYQKPFYVIDGTKDARISTLLKLTASEPNSIPLNVEEKDIPPRPLVVSTALLKEQQEKSKRYLLTALGIK